MADQLHASSEDRTVIHFSELALAIKQKLPELPLRQPTPVTAESTLQYLTKSAAEINPAQKQLVDPSPSDTQRLEAQAHALGIQPTPVNPEYSRLPAGLQRQAKYGALRADVARGLERLIAEHTSGKTKASDQLADFVALEHAAALARLDEKVNNTLTNPNSEYIQRKEALTRLQTQTLNPQAQELFPDLVIAGNEKIPKVETDIRTSLHNLSVDIADTEKLGNMVKHLRGGRNTK